MCSSRGEKWCSLDLEAQELDDLAVELDVVGERVA